MTALLFLGFSLVLAMALLSTGERCARDQADAKIFTISTPRDGRIPATVCRGKANRRKVSEHVSVTVAIADTDNPGTALQIFDVYGKPLITIPTSHVAMVHGWLDGQPVLSQGESRHASSLGKPSYPGNAAWEVEIVTTSGTLYRCVGLSGDPVNADLLRLRQRMTEGVLARAS